jgi:succinate-semialdehyde dehydrogenase / glutarate-semialdehyde dehydrogenase
MTMELGGHAPVIVLPDIDVPAVVGEAVAAAFRNSGQICTSPTRFFVHDDIYDPFVEEFSKTAASLRVGDPFDPDVQMGPLANTRRLRVMEAMVRDAHRRGSRVVTGGERLGGDGLFWAPTVYADGPDDMLAATEEPFGPVAGFFRFSLLTEAISRSNQLPFGLSGYVFTNDIASAQAAADGLECGSIAVNHWQASLPETPFGGQKASGFGSEGGVEGLSGFLQVKYVSERVGSSGLAGL